MAPTAQLDGESTADQLIEKQVGSEALLTKRRRSSRRCAKLEQPLFGFATRKRKRQCLPQAT
jgi:hypothetical protein